MALLDQLADSLAANRGFARALSGRDPGHAFLVEAPSAPMARWFARRLGAALACLGEGEGACGACAVCRDPHPPHLETVAPLGVEYRIAQIHRIAEECRIALPPGERRVYVLDSVEALNEESANAFLKLLEEPPRAVTFILATGSPRRVLGTIRSRCRSLRADFPSSEAILTGRPAGNPAVPGGEPIAAHWLFAILEVWGRTPRLLESALGSPSGKALPSPRKKAARKSSGSKKPGPAAAMPEAVAALVAHHERQPPADLADPTEGLFCDLGYTVDATAFFLGSLGRVLEGSELEALEEAAALTRWTESLAEAVSKGLHAVEEETRARFGPGYGHPLLEEPAFERSYQRRVTLLGLDAYFKAALMLARCALQEGGNGGRLGRLTEEHPAVREAWRRDLAWARRLVREVETARAQLRSNVTVRYVLDSLLLGLAAGAAGRSEGREAARVA